MKFEKLGSSKEFRSKSKFGSNSGTITLPLGPKLVVNENVVSYLLVVRF